MGALIRMQGERGARDGSAKVQLTKFGFLAASLCLVNAGFAQSLAITSPGAAQVVSGLSFPLTVSVSSVPNLGSVEYIVDGESQGIVWQAPWRISSWNTNSRYNGTQHQIWAIARDSMGNTIVTAPTITFGIANSYLEPQSYIALSGCTPSTAITVNWSGALNLQCTFTGTNAANNKSAKLYVDGDYSAFTTLSPATATTMNVNVNTTRYPNGAHQVILDFYDTNGTAPTEGGYPFGEWAAQVTFSNSSTITLVNSIANFDNSGTTYTSFNAPASGSAVLTAGDFVLACAADFGGGTITVSDTAGNTYTAVNSGSTQSNWKQQCFYSANATGSSSNVYTMHISGAVKDVALLVREYSGVATSSPIDTQITSTGTSCAAAPCTTQSGTFTTSNANDAIVLYYLPCINGPGYLPGLNSVLDNPASVNTGNGGGTSQYVSSTITNGTTSISASNAVGMTFGMTVVALKAASSTPQSTPATLTLSPIDWVAAPGGTVQLTPKITNDDGTTTSVTSGMNPVYSATGPCSVSSSGLVTASTTPTFGSAAAFGQCQVTATIGNGMSETISGWVSASNVIPYFGTDGAIHTSGGTPVWFASMFMNAQPQGFFDVNKTNDQFGIPYGQAGFNVLENNMTDVNNWNGSAGTCTSFQSGVNTLIGSASTPGTTNYILNHYNLFFHGVTINLISGSSPSQLYVGVKGLGSTCTPQSWQYLTQQWAATGHLMGISLCDECDALYSDIIPSPVISSSGPFTGITCTTGTSPVCTVYYGPPPTASSGPNKFAIFGATTNSVLNSTIGNSSTLYSFSGLGTNGFHFNAPSGASGITVTPTSDPSIRIEGLVYEWEANGTDYTPYAAFATLSSLVHAGGGIITGAPRAIAGSGGGGFYNQASWGGACSYFSSNFSDFAEIYNQPTNTYGPSQYVPLTTIKNGNLNIVYNDRTFISNSCTFRAFLGQSTFTNLDYGLAGSTVSGVSCVGSLCTWPSPHGIYNIIPNVTRVTFSGSSNSYFNANFFILNCPTSTTCNVYRQSLSQTPSNCGTVSTPCGTLTWSNGAQLTTSTNWCIGGVLYSNCGGDTLASQYQNYRGLPFTISGAQGTSASYWNSTPFVLYNYPIPYSTGNPAYPIAEMPPSSQVSGSMTATVYLDNTYHRGLSQNVLGEIVNGPRTPFASIMAHGVLGASGHRGYSLGTDYNISFSGFPGTTVCNSAVSLNCIQASASPLYNMGDADLVRTFQSASNANLLLQRLASTGYLYQPRGPAPDLGFNFISSLRQGSNGNLLMTLNLQDGSMTETVDLSACDVSGQKKIRYVVDWRSIAITELSVGTLSDTPTWPAGGAVVYLCPKNEASEYMPPVMSARMADVTGATTVAIHYAYAPYLLEQGTNDIVNCGSAMCVLPIDLKIGPLYYCLQYLNSNGVVLATSDVQIL